MSKKKEYSTPLHSAKEESEQYKANSAENVSEYNLAIQDETFLLRSEVRPLRVQMELMRPELVLNDHDIDEAMIFFGSARIPEPEVAQDNLKQAKKNFDANPNDLKLKKLFKQAQNELSNSVYLEEAYKLAQITSTASNWTVITGGGPSFMRAANKGAFDLDKPSIALSVVLPHEQAPNEFVTPELTFQFHYFAIRKMHFLMRSRALAAFPGGFGTLDELFETLTLIQTQKIDPLPLVLFGKRFWQNIINLEAMAEEGVISNQDLDLVHYVETAEEAWEFITDFYK